MASLACKCEASSVTLLDKLEQLYAYFSTAGEDTRIFGFGATEAPVSSRTLRDFDRISLHETASVPQLQGATGEQMMPDSPACRAAIDRRMEALASEDSGPSAFVRLYGSPAEPEQQPIGAAEVATAHGGAATWLPFRLATPLETGDALQHGFGVEAAQATPPLDPSHGPETEHTARAIIAYL